MASGPITSWQIDGENVETVSDFIFLGSKIAAPWKNSYDKPGQWIKKQKYHFANKGPFNQSYRFSNQIRWDHSLSCVRLFATPWIAVPQASLSLTNSRSSLRLTSIESVMPSSHLILCRPLLLLPPIPPSIRVFSNESTLRIRWPKYWSFSFSISLSKVRSGFIQIQREAHSTEKVWAITEGECGPEVWRGWFL